MHYRQLFFLIFMLSCLLLPSSPLSTPRPRGNRLSTVSGRNFSRDLETLQKDIGYEFKTVDLLRRAMTHPSYSTDNNRALAILGLDVIQTAVSLWSLKQNIDISSKDLNNQILEITKESSCAAYGFHLGLQNVVRVSKKTNSSTPGVVCGAFKAVFGAVAVDTKKADDAGDVFWKVRRSHGYDIAVFDLSVQVQTRIDVVKVMGFHNSAPELQFICRRSVLLAINIDKTTEKDWQLAVEAATKLLAEEKVEVIDYSSHIDSSTDPGYYVIFWELSGNASEGALNECCSCLDQSFIDAGYVLSRKISAIGALELRVVRKGTFRKILDHYLALGAAASQFKTPRCIGPSNSAVLQIV